MKVYKFDKVLQSDSWVDDIFIQVDSKGVIEKISKDYPLDDFSYVEGFLFPGFQNAHSHAFQYAMAGLSECSGESLNDDFWSWRENMYHLALNLGPDEMQDIALKLYQEMLRNGYTHVAEFHYLHHDKDGETYSNLAEMSERLMIAANEAGIDMTLVPMYYERGGFNQAASKNQRRFLSKSIDAYFKLYEEVDKKSKIYRNIKTGIGIHSLRAVEASSVIKTFEMAPKGIPKHIHISEQLKEVEDCLLILGQRPVEWLANNVELDQSYHLVHATHINSKEIKMITESHANIVLCPSTEANLGDGFFPLVEYMKEGGKWSIGSDSHIGLSPMEELRWLDYGSRLQLRKRTPFSMKENQETGDLFYHQAFSSGRLAMGILNQDYFKVGEPLDGVVINKNHNLFASKLNNKILSTLIFSGDSSVFKGVIKKGKWI